LWQKISLYLMAALYIAAGANHFAHPEAYIKIMPHWVPLHKEMVFISGTLEVSFALLLIFPLTRRLAAWCIIALLIGIFPANIQMMLDYLHGHNPQLWLTVLRLPLQIVLIWWAHSFTKPAAVK
jgi:uncharacterized membrane protein